ncbi:MAG: low specificity L-threonine aldolase [Alphaproteobacteria bacterium]|nr:low specificity L-threonine aldolase [Alphaproteobacteria bacterium]
MFDFYSDTKTKPTRGMREAVLDAEVGDEQKGEDPTTNALCARVAKLLGKEAAVFLPSGSMCNEIAIAIQCRPGDEVLCDQTCHILNFEAGGPAALSGVVLTTLDGDLGRFSGEQVRAAVRSKSRYFPSTRMVSVEQTANLGGGAVWSSDAIDEVVDVAREHGLVTHMDGARLMNAVVASGVPAARYTQGMDSCWIDFSKGLGAPVGGVLAGSADFIEQAWHFKQQWGGAMRQSGVLAAMCLYALDHNVDRLAEDHALAAEIGEALSQMQQVKHVVPVATNIIFFDIADGGPDEELLTALALEAGFVIGPYRGKRIRLLTHLDVDQTAADALITFLRKHLD